MAQFKDLFTELRRDTGLSQEDFAALFHQSGSTISSYETGRNQPSFDMLIQYADYFNVTTDYLLGRVPFDMSPSVSPIHLLTMSRFKMLYRYYKNCLIIADVHC